MTCCLGPLRRLSILGTFCPCHLTESDRNAHSSYKKLSSLLSNGVTWYKPPSPSSQKSSGVFNLLSAGTDKKWTPCESTAKLIDSPKGPALEIQPRSTTTLDYSQPNDSDSENEDHSEMNPLRTTTSQKQTKILIPLCKIGVIRRLQSSSVSKWVSKTVSSTNCTGIAIYAHSNEFSGSNGTSQGEELLRFDIENEEDVVDYCTILVEWERSRRKLQDVVDDDEEEEEVATQPKKGALRTKAEKAAHFAKRELEMKQRKREREQRKAKYLKDAGGLKYTALAMANREG